MAEKKETKEKPQVSKDELKRKNDSVKNKSKSSNEAGKSSGDSVKKVSEVKEVPKKETKVSKDDLKQKEKSSTEKPKEGEQEKKEGKPKEAPPTSVQIPNRMSRRQGETIEWIPKTRLGKEVVAGKYNSVEEILNAGEIILEPEIVDYLIPDLKQEIIFIGGTPGKGGGARRTPTRMTARMHKSGRRFKLTALITIGNENGILGLGKATSQEHMVAIGKAAQHAKLSVINVKRGCGSWECNCGGNHSIPLKTQAKVSSVTVKFFPTPTGVGIVADNETKKILRLAGVKDVWVKTFGKTSTRMNLAFAVFNALKNLSVTKGDF